LEMVWASLERKQMSFLINTTVGILGGLAICRLYEILCARKGKNVA